MGTKAESRKVGRSLKFESLEGRDAMAAMVDAKIDRGILVVEGTRGNDSVQISVFSNNLTRVLSQGKIIKQFATTDYSGMSVKMLDGQDNLRIEASNHTALLNVHVNMGTGGYDFASIDVGSTRRLNVDVKQSASAKVVLKGNVVDEAFVDFGDDSGRDYLDCDRCDINRFVVKMGSGNDQLSLSRARIQNANINLGAGNDTVMMDDRSDVVSGGIEGGAGEDTFKKSGAPAARLSLRGIEKRR